MIYIYIYILAPNTANYYVLDTDYDSYAVVYSCRNKNSEERVGK